MSADYMTEEQRKILCARIDAAAEKDIPASAWEYMRHRPYDINDIVMKSHAEKRKEGD